MNWLKKSFALTAPRTHRSPTAEFTPQEKEVLKAIEKGQIDLKSAIINLPPFSQTKIINYFNSKQMK